MHTYKQTFTYTVLPQAAHIHITHTYRALSQAYQHSCVTTVGYQVLTPNTVVTACKQTYRCSGVKTMTQNHHIMNGSKRHCSQHTYIQKYAYMHTNIYTHCVNTSWSAEPGNNQRFQVTTHNTSHTVCKQTKSCIGVTTVTHIGLHQTMNVCKRHRSQHTRTDICTHGNKQLHTRRYHKLISTAV